MTDPDTISAHSHYTLRPNELAETLAWHCHVWTPPVLQGRN